MTKITPEEIKLLSKYILNISGIYLEQAKGYLIETRLGPLLEELGVSTYGELYHKARADNLKFIEKNIIAAISTNETLFFRDKGPFELIRHKILPDLIDCKSEKISTSLPVSIRIWSAACSTGQEIYSIAIIIKELLQNSKNINIKLLGTDISDAAISQASYGKYNKFEIERGLPKDKLEKYFTANGSSWKIKDDIRAMASFKKLNLMLPFAGLGKFDIVFLRNVIIYFSMEDRKKVLNNLINILEPDGYLIVGASESLTGICNHFVPKRYLNSIFYQLK